MNASTLLDYALKQLEGAELEACEAELASDPVQAREFEPPADLLARTLQRVTTPAASPLRIDWAPRRVAFRAADLAVAALVLLAGLLTLFPAFVRMRAQSDTARCMSQLQQLGMGLMAYAVDHGHYPQPPANHMAGYYGIQLLKDKTIEDPKLLVCPSRSPHAELIGLKVPDQFDGMMHSEPQVCEKMLENAYAYHVGYRARASKPSPLPARLTSVMPLLADCPPLEGRHRVVDGNSPNHGGNGQNVLFSDHHVQWLRHRSLPPFNDDIYLNADRRVDMGVDQNDAALLPAVWRVSQ
jgi:hypothetical protein